MRIVLSRPLNLPKFLALRRGRLPAVILLVAACAPSAGLAAQLSIAPRASLYFDNISQRQSGQQKLDQQSVDQLVANIDAQYKTQFGPTASLRRTGSESSSSNNQVSYRLLGATFSFAWPGHERVQVSLTGQYGTSDVAVSSVLTLGTEFSLGTLRVRDTAAASVRGNTRLQRADVEATLQFPLNETISLMGGLRVEQTGVDSRGTQTFNTSLNVYNAVAQLNGFPPLLNVSSNVSAVSSRATIRLYSLRFGAAGFAPVGDHHLFFINGFLHASHTPGVSATRTFAPIATPQNISVDRVRIPGETSIGPDITVGYLYRITDRLAVDFRYRAVIYFPVSGISNFSDSRVNHGASASFSFSLGR